MFSLVESVKTGTTRSTNKLSVNMFTSRWCVKRNVAVNTKHHTMVDKDVHCLRPGRGYTRRQFLNSTIKLQTSLNEGTVVCIAQIVYNNVNYLLSLVVSFVHRSTYLENSRVLLLLFIVVLVIVWHLYHHLYKRHNSTDKLTSFYNKE